jgi:hypothetical protein
MNEIKVNSDTPAFVSWLAAVHATYDAYMERNYPNNIRATTVFEAGPRYIRVVREEGPTSRSVYCFIDRTTGDVLKAGGWKSPAKNPIRGNIFAADNGLNCTSHYGLLYLR